MGTYTTQDLENQLTRIANAVAACRTAIYNRGVNIPADAKLADLATYAAMIDCSHPDILLEYLANGPDNDSENVRNVYFNTGFVPDASTSIEIKCAGVQISKGVNIPIISSANSSWQGYGVFLPMNDGKITARLGTSYVSSISMTSNTTYTLKTYVSGTTGHVILNSTDYTNNTTNTYGNVPAYLFGYNINGTVNTTVSYSGLKIYYLKIWEDNNLVHFYVPVLHYINHQYVACFYDKVNDTYIYNLGTDDVTYASTGDYLLDYIGARNESAIPVTDQTNIRYATGVVADATIQVDTKFRLLWGGENYIYGSATDNTTTPTWQVFGIGYPGNNTKLRLNFGARSTAVNITDPGVDASTATTSSLFFDSSLGRCYLNGIKYNNGYQSTLFSSNGIDLFSRHGNSQNVPVRNGARIYYCTMSKGKVVQKTYVPVLHNDSPYFLDLNTGNYLSHDGSGTPTYNLLD